MRKSLLLTAVLGKRYRNRVFNGLFLAGIEGYEPINGATLAWDAATLSMSMTGVDYCGAFQTVDTNPGRRYAVSFDYKSLGATMVYLNISYVGDGNLSGQTEARNRVIGTTEAGNFANGFIATGPRTSIVPLFDLPAGGRVRNIVVKEQQ